MRYFDPRQQTSKPDLVIFERTRQCGDDCLHNEAYGRSVAGQRELSTWEAYRLIEQIGDLRPSDLVIAGDPLAASDLFEILDYAIRRGMKPAVALPANDHLTPHAMQRLRDAGVDRIILPIEGPDEAAHDAAMQEHGSFELVASVMNHARIIGLAVEAVTSVTERSARALDEIRELLEILDVQRWTLIFPATTDEAEAAGLDARRVEQIFATIYDQTVVSNLQIDTREAPHYQRYAVHRRFHERWIAEPQHAHGSATPPALQPRRLLFVAHTGEVYASLALPISLGNIMLRDLTEIYFTSALLDEIHDPARLRGKCRICEFRKLCGGSRARAYNLTGDLLAPDPYCTYKPGDLAREWLRSGRGADEPAGSGD